MKKESDGNVPRGLPANAKLVFEGVLFEVWQWEQKLFDGTTAVFEKVVRPDTAQVIPVVGDKVLVIEQHQSHMPHAVIGIPGGRRDAGETPLESARRELLEESGYASDDWIEFDVQQPVEKMIWTVYTFVARGCRRIQDMNLDAGERISPVLLSFDDFVKLPETGNFYDRELNSVLLRARFDPVEKQKLRDLLFGGVS